MRQHQEKPKRVEAVSDPEELEVARPADASACEPRHGAVGQEKHRSRPAGPGGQESEPRSAHGVNAVRDGVGHRQRERRMADQPVEADVIVDQHAAERGAAERGETEGSVQEYMAQQGDSSARLGDVFGDIGAKLRNN